MHECQQLVSQNQYNFVGPFCHSSVVRIRIRFILDPSKSHRKITHYKILIIFHLKYTKKIAFKIFFSFEFTLSIFIVIYQFLGNQKKKSLKSWYFSFFRSNPELDFTKRIQGSWSASKWNGSATLVKKVEITEQIHLNNRLFLRAYQLPSRLNWYERLFQYILKALIWHAKLKQRGLSSRRFFLDPCRVRIFSGSQIMWRWNLFQHLMNICSGSE
mgnify:CR=1 FL=1